MGFFGPALMPATPVLGRLMRLLTQVVVIDPSCFSLSSENKLRELRRLELYPIFPINTVVHIVNKLVRMVRFVLE